MSKVRLTATAAAYVREHGMDWRGDGVLEVVDSFMPRAVRRTLTRVYGPAHTIDRGEVGHWRIPEIEVQS